MTAAKYRLDNYRAEADRRNWKAIPQCPSAYVNLTWRDTRKRSTESVTYANWSKDRTMLFCDATPSGWRNAGTVSEILDSRNVPTGYYADNNQDETIRAEVLQLPSRRGRAVLRAHDTPYRRRA